MKPSGLALIGLTGGIACGKSSVLSMLADRGAWTLDADTITHRLQQPGTFVYDQIVATFGSQILTAPDGPIDRRQLGERVFHDPAEMNRLEHIIHPAVRAEVVAWMASIILRTSQTPASAAPTARPVAVFDAIKLLETGWKAYSNEVWVVTCNPDQQIERLIRRNGLDPEQARQRIAVQPPQEQRAAQADVIIDNSGTLEQTIQQVENAWQHFVSRHASTTPA
jgi:dephospho-CoA kinase